MNRRGKSFECVVRILPLSTGENDRRVLLLMADRDQFDGALLPRG